MIRQCANCENWQGQSSDYMALCTDNGQRTMFDYVCSHHIARQAVIDEIAVVSIPASAIAPGVITLTNRNAVRCPKCNDFNVMRNQLGMSMCNNCGNIWK